MSAAFSSRSLASTACHKKQFGESSELLVKIRQTVSFVTGRTGNMFTSAVASGMFGESMVTVIHSHLASNLNVYHTTGLLTISN